MVATSQKLKVLINLCSLRKLTVFEDCNIVGKFALPRSLPSAFSIRGHDNRGRAFFASRLRFDVLMQVNARRIARLEDRSGSRHLIGGTMCHDKISISFHGFFVLDDAVFGNPNAEERRAKCAEPTDQDRTLDSSNDHGGQVAKHHDGSDYRNCQKYSPEEQAPDSAPKGAILAPKFDPITDVVKAHDLLIGMEALSDNTEMRHVEATTGKFADGILCVPMVCEYSDHGVLLFNLVCMFVPLLKN